MSYWLKPTLAELFEAHQTMTTDDTIKVAVRYAPNDDPTLEEIFALKGHERITKATAVDLCGEAELAVVVEQACAVYASALASGKLAAAARELATANLEQQRATSGG